MSGGSLSRAHRHRTRTHVYTTPGTYTVTLQTSNVGGYNTTQKTGYITVTSGAVAPVVASPAP